MGTNHTSEESPHAAHVYAFALLKASGCLQQSIRNICTHLRISQKYGKKQKQYYELMLRVSKRRQAR